MNDEKLKEILSDTNISPYHESAKKQALTLAMAEFDRIYPQPMKKKTKKIQGFSWLFRLIGNTYQDNWSKAMTKSWVYGGLGTAAVAILAFGLLFSNINTNMGMGSILELENDRPRMQVQTDRQKQKKAHEYASETRLAQSDQQQAIQAKEKQTSKKSDSMVRAPAQKSSAAKNEAIIMIPQATTISGLAMGEDFSLEEQRLPRPMISEELLAPLPSFQDQNRDQFQNSEQSSVKKVSESPVSTFSIDVDTAAYSFMRKSLNAGHLPPKNAVRSEEMLNYFNYAWPTPQSQKKPFKTTVAITPSPWTSGNQLIHIGIKGYDLPTTERPRSNLVFLLDVSGSMNAPDKLPLVKNALRMLVDTLKPSDTVAIVVYAGAAGTILEPTAIKHKAKILASLERLSAGGSTAGAQGIQLAYDLVQTNFDPQAVNRIILATDGDFNVGVSNPEELKGFIERKRKSGVYLSILGFGRGNWNDQLMQTLAQNGNGVAAYIDTLSEARKVLVEEATSTLFPIAKDVKLQLEFNPARVSEYRLVGYESRALKREDFNNDAVDAGDIGAGHTVTAIYEITPKGASGQKIDDSRYQHHNNVKSDSNKTSFDAEYAFLKIRYKLPKSNTSDLITTAITNEQTHISDSVANEVRWATSVASFAQLLQGGQYTGKLDYEAVIELAQQSKGTDPFGYRAEFINLVRLAQSARSL